MKRSVFVVLILAIAFNLHSQTLRTVENNAFKRGETIRYKAYYDAILTGKVNAGEAELVVKDENTKIANRNTFHVVGLGLTKGAFNIFFKVVDRYETYIDEESMIPWLFIRRVNEGGYKISQDVTFNQYKNTATTLNNKNSVSTTSPVIANIQDIISAFYYARTLDFTDAKEGQTYDVPFFLDDSVYTSKIVYQGKEVLTIGLGKFTCLKFKPMVATGNVFSDPYPMVFWITDDKNHLPVLVESKILVGSVKLELIKYSGLANPLTAKIK
ncbi:MAG TPA: DUF3108 domain-containing protein [Bacteroidales bacterium]|nr:DUF3108 domain-containing protein [Bacteroidales bacterium]